MCRHESGAAYMADGFYRATGKPGIVLVTSGPGATNALTGTTNAFFGGSAILVLTGEVSEQFLGRGYLQEGVDCGLNVRDIYAAATRYSADIEDASGAPIVIEQALRDMLSLPRRAVHISVPDNVAATAIPTGAYLSARPPASPKAYRSLPGGASPSDVGRALSVLSSASRPLILLGNGCREALRDPETSRALHCLVEWWQIPVMTTSDGKGVFPETHALSLRSYGFAGCQWPQYWMVDQTTKAVAHDALLVMGSSLGELATYKWNPILVPKGPFLQVDIDQSVIGRGMPVTDGIVAECGAFLRAMWDQAPAWKRDSDKVAARGAAIAAIKEQNAPIVSIVDYENSAAPLHPAALCRLLNENLPDDALVFIDSGNCVGWSHALSGRAPRPGGAECACHGADGFWRLRSRRSTTWATGSAMCGARRRRGTVDAPGRDHDRGGAKGRRYLDRTRLMTIWAWSRKGMDTFFPDAADPYHYRLGAPDLRKAVEGLGADAYELVEPTDFPSIWQATLKGAAAGRPQVIVARIDRNAAPPYWTALFMHQFVE